MDGFVNQSKVVLHGVKEVQIEGGKHAKHATPLNLGI